LTIVSEILNIWEQLHLVVKNKKGGKIGAILAGLKYHKILQIKVLQIKEFFLKVWVIKSGRNKFRRIMFYILLKDRPLKTLIKTRKKNKHLPPEKIFNLSNAAISIFKYCFFF
jgi:hypothetical protein